MRLRIGIRILRRFFDRFVERRLLGPRFLILRHDLSLHPACGCASMRMKACSRSASMTNAYSWAQPTNVLD
jgi:hypothetical protein